MERIKKLASQMGKKVKHTYMPHFAIDALKKRRKKMKPEVTVA